MSHNELKTKLHDYQELRKMMHELQDELAGIEESIKAHMGEKEEISVDGIKVKWTRYTSRRFDSGTFKKEHAAMYEQYTKATESRRFSIA